MRVYPTKVAAEDCGDVIFTMELFDSECASIEFNKILLTKQNFHSVTEAMKEALRQLEII